MSERQRRRVVITGIGAVTPIGHGRDGLWQGVRLGESAVRRVRHSMLVPIAVKWPPKFRILTRHRTWIKSSSGDSDRYSQFAVCRPRWRSQMLVFVLTRNRLSGGRVYRLGSRGHAYRRGTAWRVHSARARGGESDAGRDGVWSGSLVQYRDRIRASLAQTLLIAIVALRGRLPLATPCA